MDGAIMSMSANPRYSMRELEQLLAGATALRFTDDMAHWSKLIKEQKAAAEKQSALPICSECGEDIEDGEKYDPDPVTGEPMGHSECLAGRGIAGDRRDDSGYWKEDRA
ncbi:hypothetical protein SEA_RASPUTIA_85 [Microbacterium phage Rasputia]|nr:hypothetical protein SEA_RASPUTIA_85 [Microbacterium phage Rasputia]